MLNSTKMVVSINNKTIGYIKALNISILADNIIVLAEVTTTNPQTQENVVAYYAVESIDMVNKKTYINLAELDYSPSFSSSEKIIDIREFKNKTIKEIK